MPPPKGRSPERDFRETKNGGTQGTLKSRSLVRATKITVPRNPRLVRNAVHEDKQTPSAFLAEMSLTTDERLRQTNEMRLPQIIELLDMSETTHQKFTTRDIEEPLFQPFPSEIIYQKFEPFKTYRIPLQLRNNDKVARLVKVCHADSPYFKIISPPDVGHKVAPGMEKVFMIEFTPEEKKDYNHELICITEREKFLVPVHAIGARGILDLPDELNFETCPVKHLVTKTLFVRNIGDKEAKFTLVTESPFSASPDNGVLNIGESMQIDINFHAFTNGDHHSHLILQYDSGEIIYISLYGSTEDVNVRLEKSSIKLENTFISSASQRTVSIFNRSNVITHYAWKPFPTQVEEDQHKQRFYQDLSHKEEEDKESFLEECIRDPTLRDQLSLLSRSYENRIKVAQGDKMLYNDDIISLDPLEGDIWPNSKADISVIFRPEEAKSYSRTAYCDVTGREIRLPLTIKGDGLGPKIQFSFDTLDVGEIFMNSSHSYEVVLANKGDIDAVFTYQPSESLFGSRFTFTPSNGIVRTGDYQAIQIQFSSPFLGEFLEDFLWAIEGSPFQVKFSVRGIVIGPTFHFNASKLRFGIVSYGFPYLQNCALANTSLIPMSFKLRVPSDGKGKLASQIAAGFTDIDGPVRNQEEFPLEFEILPNSGVLPPQSEMQVQINFTPLAVRKYETLLVVDVDGVGEEVLSLPISARCVVPAITLQTPVLDYGRCFIRFPYEKTVELRNDSDLPVKYELLSQVVSEETTIRYQSAFSKGIIKGKSILELPLQIMAYTIGHQKTTAYFAIFGSNEQPIQLQINCIGEGPVVHVSEENLDFGVIPVLTDVSRELTLSNESLIPSKFFCELGKTSSPFLVEPSEGMISPEDFIKLKITANINDVTRFLDKFIINFVDNASHTIHLAAQGTGSTIISEPTMTSGIDLGPIFSSRVIQKKFTLTNKGKRVQQIFWVTEGFPHAKTKKRPAYSPEDIKYQKMPPPPDPPRPVFKLIPERLTLHPGQRHEVTLEGYSETPQVVRERMICYSIIGSSTGKEKIMKVDIHADFICPLLDFSERSISFCVMKYPETELVKEVKQLILTNISKLPLNAKLSIEYPFQLLFEDAGSGGGVVSLSEVNVHLDVKQDLTLLVEFDPAYDDHYFCKSVSSSLKIAYTDHPNKDEIELKGDVYFPNLTFATNVVDFGCVVNDTEHIQEIGVKNDSPIDVNFKWSFIEGRIAFEAREEDEGLGHDLSDAEMGGPAHVPSPRTVPEALMTGDASTEDSTERPFTATSLIVTEQVEDNANRTSLVNNGVNTTLFRNLWMQKDVSIEESFDVLPLFGTLKSGESQQFHFTYYGHAHSLSQVVAKCSVNGGPDYLIQLKGQASLVLYKIIGSQIDLGKQLHDNVSSAQITLCNTGKVGFEFTCPDIVDGAIPKPLQLAVMPKEGYVASGTEVSLTIKYIPGIPEKFTKQFQVRVGHFAPELITVTGEGVYPYIKLNLPRDTSDPRYEKYMGQAEASSTNKDSEDYFEDLQDEIDRLIVQDFAMQLLESDECGVTKPATSKSGKRIKQRASLIPYVLDFGHVIHGHVKSHLCQATSAGVFPVSFMAERNEISGTGFTVELDRVKALPGYPFNESIDFVVTFDSKSANLSIGPVETLLPIKVLNGPSIGILLRAYVTMPSVTLSCDMIDFESVICGQCKVVTLQLYNPTQVRCNWKSEPPQDKKKSLKHVPMHLRKKLKEEKPLPKVFELMPPGGMLYPQQRLNVQVKFMPTEEKQYNQKLAIRIAQSSAKIALSCSGRGLEPRISMEENILTFGPILPHSAGEEKELLVHNPCSFGVEFYSLEFDRQYLYEEKVLRSMKGYDESNTILLPPRIPGEELPAELVRAFEALQSENSYVSVDVQVDRTSEPETVMVERKVETGKSDSSFDIFTDIKPGEAKSTEVKSAEVKSAEVKPAEVKSAEVKSAEVVGNNKLDSKEGGEKPIQGDEIGAGELEITPVSAAIARYLGIDLTAEGKAARNRRGIAVIVHGAPLSGKSATASDLGKTYNVPVFRVDEIVTEAVVFGNSSAARRAQELCIAAGKTFGLGEEEVTPELSAAAALSAHPTALSSGNRKPSTMIGARGVPHGPSKTTSGHPSPPVTPPTSYPPKKKLSVPENSNLHDDLFTTILPEDILVEIIADRLQRVDCHNGVIFDGLQSNFTSGTLSTANSVLRAINNRKYIYALHLKFSKEALKAIEKKNKEDEARHQREIEEADRQRLEEMSEEEYENLPAEERAEVDRKQMEIKRERILRKKKEKEEQKERERRDKEMMEEKKLEEERVVKSKQRRLTTSQQGSKKEHEKMAKDKKTERSSEKLQLVREPGLKPHSASGEQRKAVGNNADNESQEEEEIKKKVPPSRGSKFPRASSVAGRHTHNASPVDPRFVEEDEFDKELSRRFQLYENSCREVNALFEAWDRTIGSVVIPEMDRSEQDMEPSAVTSKKGLGGQKRQDRDREKERLKDISESPSCGQNFSQVDVNDGTTFDETKSKEDTGVPTINLSTAEPQKSLAKEALNANILPLPEKVLEGLGLGSIGPPVPPPAFFTVVPYPVRRQPPSVSDFGHHYFFVPSSPDDPNAAKQEKPKVQDHEMPEKVIEKKEHKRDRKNREREDRDSHRSRADRLPSGGRRGKNSVLNAAAVSPPSISPNQMEEDKNSELARHRWVVPPQGSIKLKIRFTSEQLGQFDQTLNFELVGTRRRYQVFCRGICCFPGISREPRIVFPSRRKEKRPEEIVHKKYILSSETYEFGPLLAGKNRDRYREGRYPENMEQITILNTSPVEATVSFCFQNDTNASTFLLEPKNMLLEPGQSKLLRIWAYPKTPGFFEDVVVCCIRENPEPTLFKISASGVRPELELDKKIIQFERVLLHRKETRTIYLRNSTLLPVAWKLNGMDNLGDDFAVTTDQGIIEPKSEYALQLHFRAIRATIVKKIIRLEVSDADNVIGLAHSENITVQAEAYDVALDMSFPKGADGGLDFGVLRVGDEAKQVCSLKNKGKYEISYSFVFEPLASVSVPLNELFTVLPPKGSLISNDRPTQVQVIFKSKDEIAIKEEPTLRCQIIEPHIGDTGEIIASIPVKLSVRAVYSRYAIFPVQDVNFGAALLYTRRTKTLSIENRGEFDFRYSITKSVGGPSQPRSNRGPPNLKKNRSREGSASGRSIQAGPLQQTKPKRSDSVKVVEPVQTGGTASLRLQVGLFTIFPANGAVLPGGTAQVTIDMYSEVPSVGEEDICIDISERPPKDHPGGIEYKIIGEACLPMISCISKETISSIFEEHRIVHDLSLFRYHTSELKPGSGVYGEHDNKFVFYNVIVGHRAKGRFKISNPTKVQCDVVISVRPASNRPSAKWHDIYEVDVQRAIIPPHGHIFATVTFQPPSMQNFTAIFEAAVETASGGTAKSKTLSFEIQGEGNLPRLCVIKPLTASKLGNPVLLFNKLLVGRVQSQMMSFRNDGPLICGVNLTKNDPSKSFTLYTLNQETGQKAPFFDKKTVNAAMQSISILLAIGEELHLQAEFSPKEASRLAAEVRLSVVDNPFEDTLIRLIGEGFQEEVTIDNISTFMPHEINEMEEQDIQAPRGNHVNFGDCEIGVSKRLTFTLTNHSTTDAIRFMWSAPPQITFIPSTGHLQPSCAKDIIVQLLSNEPFTLSATNIPCKISKIQLQPGLGKVIDWDDRMKVVKWIDQKPDNLIARQEEPGKVVTLPANVPKSRVVETEPEPAHVVIPGSAAELELLFTATSDYADYQISTTAINFKDTLMFQTRVYSFTVTNKGTITLHLDWEMKSGLPPLPLDKSPEPVTEVPTAPKTDLTGPKSKGRVTPRDTMSGVPRRKSTQSDVVSEMTVPSRGSEAGSQSVLRSSAMATASDGRPASVMALTYEAADFFSPNILSEDLPFTVEPASAAIKPKEERRFTLRFCPYEPCNYLATLSGNIANLRPELQPPLVALTGRSAMPWCHFDLEESDYVSNRRNPELKGPAGAPPGSRLDSSIHVIEFVTSGVNAKLVRRFKILNPTDTDYSFKWTNEDNLEGFLPAPAQFICLTPTGKVSGGKKADVEFEFCAKSLEVVESFWRFHITEHNVSVPFLLVGSSSEPAVSFDKSHVNFKELLVGHSAQEIVNLINDEERPYSFSFLEASCHTPGKVVSLQVTPMSGVIPPNSKIPVIVQFSPKHEDQANFNLVCRVKQKPTPLYLNVKAEGFQVNVSLACEDSKGNRVLLSSSESNLINFGECEVNEKSIRQMFLENLSRFSINFSWKMTTSGLKPKKSKSGVNDAEIFSVAPMTGTVVPSAKKRCQLSFCPLSKGNFNDNNLHLKVQHGPTYHITLNGVGKVPSLDFSFLSHDFGHCFLFRAGLPLQKKTLVIENTDEKDISLECHYEPKNHLDVVFEAKVLSPGEKVTTDFVFYPRELKKYHERITYEVNGLSKVYVDIYGEGTPMKVHVLDPSEKSVSLGAVRINEVVEREVKVINNSSCGLDFLATVTPSVPALQQLNVLSVFPDMKCPIKPKEIFPVRINFAPTCRIPPFSEEVTLEFAGLSMPLFVISGSCHAMEIFLETESLPFGSVTLGSSSSRTLVMHNSGDIGAAFCWNSEKFKPDFSIAPMKGYLSPGMDIVFTITFTPTSVSQDLRYDDLLCAIEGGKPLKLTLSGSCIPQMPLKEVVQFSTHVRNRDTKNLLIQNKTNQTWRLKPLIDGEFWSGPDLFVVEAQQTKNYEIVYRPLVMTLDGKKHTGSVFFALPDGNGLLYNLSGTSEPPKAIGNITREVPCKMHYTEVFPVSNWLKKPQRFRVIIDILKPEKPDPATTLKGLDYIDLPGLCKKKEYKLHFYTHKEGTFNAKVTFKNDLTGEYQFYYVQFKATPPGIYGTINLRTPARQSACHVVTINNPLSTTVNFQVNCNVSEVNIPPQFTVPPQSDGYLTLEYLPVKGGEVNGRLGIQSSDLGLFLYDLCLEATPPGMERVVHFTTTLGTGQVQTCKFVNFSRTKVEYLCKVDNAEFLVDKSITAASSVSGGSEVGVDVTFEPSRIGEARGTLTLSSPLGGEYIFPLQGHCLPPKPQGPYTIKAGASITIPFKNVFLQTTAFNFRIDNPAFSVKSGETIRAKKVHSIVVSYDGNQSESKAVRMGRMEITCARSAGATNSIRWTYYLKGVTP